MSHSLPRITSLPRRNFSEGGSPVTYHSSLLIILPIALCCFALWPAPNAFGVSPAPDGGYPGANTAEGQNALQNLTSGIHNTALGYQTLFNNTTGHDNMASGCQALFSNTTGSLSTAYGPQALYHNTTGNYSTATGFRALYSNTAGIDNTANGYETLAFNTTGHDNMANGFKALYNNTSGIDNTANGSQALYKHTTGNYNTATGYQTLFNDTDGEANTATGFLALYTNTTGGQNTANGASALYSNTIGFENTAIGYEALYSNTTGFQNIALGDFAGFNLTTGQFNIDIGNDGVAGESNTIRIGDPIGYRRAFIGGIYNVNEGGTISAVYINSDGQLGTQGPPSSRRFKKEIKPMDQTSQAILRLKPVTFHYKSDPAGAGPQFGLIAEEVAKVDPDLVVRDAEGEIYSVRYDAVNAMLLNEFLKEHRNVEALKRDFQTTIAQQQKEIQMLTASLKEQAALIRKVNAQLDVIKPAPQMVLNSQ
jgi:hypothetical protein